MTYIIPVEYLDQSKEIEMSEVKSNRAWRLECEALRAELAACREAAVYLFNCGYRRGHHDTVEACYVDIHDSDMRTYQSDVVVEVIDEALAARKGEGE